MTTRLSRARREVFLCILAETGNVTAAARGAGMTRQQFYKIRRLDPSFAALWRDAEEAAADHLEAEARRRAVDGVEEPLMGGGKLIRDDDGKAVLVRRYNDRLLEFLLKACRPDKFKDKTEGSAAAHAAHAAVPSVRIVIGTDPDAASEAGDGADDRSD